MSPYYRTRFICLGPVELFHLSHTEFRRHNGTIFCDDLIQDSNGVHLRSDYVLRQERRCFFFASRTKVINTGMNKRFLRF